MNQIKNFLLNNFNIIVWLILITIIYSGYTGNYNILLYLFLLYVIFLVGFWIVIIFRNRSELLSLKLKDLKPFLTSSSLLKIFFTLIIVGTIFQSIFSTSPILFYGEKKEKIINAIAGDMAEPVMREDGVMWQSLNDNNNGIKFIYTLPYSSSVSDTIFKNQTKEGAIKTLKKTFSNKQISLLKNYDITFRFLHYNASDSLVNEIIVNPNEDF